MGFRLNSRSFFFLLFSSLASRKRLMNFVEEGMPSTELHEGIEISDFEYPPLSLSLSPPLSLSLSLCFIIRVGGCIPEFLYFPFFLFFFTNS